MAHEIDRSNGRYNMAYRGETPWHSLGQIILPGDSPEVIAQKAGLTFTIKKGKMLMQAEDGTVIDASDLNRSILYRDDTMGRLSVMSTSGFHIFQPTELVDFIASSARAMGWEIETMGSLKEGRKIWALAKIAGADFNLGTKASPDVIEGYLLAATACDGSMASEFRFTGKRVVCDNTLEMARRGQGDRLKGSLKDRDGDTVKVYHYNKLDVAAVKAQLGIANAEAVWASFIENAKRLASVKLAPKKAVKILRSVYEKVEADAPVITDEQFLIENTTARNILELYQGNAIGAELATSRGTAWGLVQATNEQYDHASKTRSVDNRLNSAWFGKGAQIKQQVFHACLDIA